MYALTVCAHELRRRLADPLGLALMGLIPLGIATIMSIAFGGGGDGPSSGMRPTVWLVDRDGGFATGMLLAGLERAPELPIDFEPVPDEQAARKRLDRGDGSALLIVPEDFDRTLLLETPTTLELVVNPKQSVLPQLVQQVLGLGAEAHFYAHRVLGSTLRSFGALSGGAPLTVDPATTATAEFSALGTKLEPWFDPPRIAVEVTVEGRSDAGADSDGADEGTADVDFGLGGVLMASLIAMAVMFSALGLSEDLWVERNSGTLLRARTAPQPLAAWLGGKLFAHAILFGALTTLALPIARFAFGVDFAGGPTPVLWVALCGAVFVTLLLIAQTIAGDQRGGTIAANLATYPLLALGGAFFPLEAMPDGLAAIGKRTPVGWALERLKHVLAGAAEPLQLAADAALVAAVGAVLFALLLRRLTAFASR